MSAEEVLEKIEHVDVNEAILLRRFLANLFCLFDGDPPPRIQKYIEDILSVIHV